MTVTSGFFNAINSDRKYNATQISELFDGLILDGVCAADPDGPGGDAFAVTQNAVPDLHVQVGEGRAWFKHTWTKSDSHLILDIETPDIVYGRIDAVVLEVDRSDAIRANSIKIIKGTASAVPQEPQMQHTATLDQYRLANIAVAANDTHITNADITYKVGTVETPFLANMVEPTFNVETLLAQWDSYFNNTWLPAREAEGEAEVDAWLSSKEADVDTEFDEWLESLVAIEVLTANRQYYVRTDGNDSNDGLTNNSLGAWRTIQHAVDVVTQTLHLASYKVTISVGAGTYNGTVFLRPYMTSIADDSNYGRVIIQGINGYTTILSSNFWAENAGCWNLKDFYITGFDVDEIYAVGRSTIYLENIKFGHCANGRSHIRALDGAMIKVFSTNILIGDHSSYHLRAENGASIQLSAVIVDLMNGNLAFDIFAFCAFGGLILDSNNTFINVGTVTGKRYDAMYNGIIFTNGGPNYYPGSIPGTTSLGGIYG